MMITTLHVLHCYRIIEIPKYNLTDTRNKSGSDRSGNILGIHEGGRVTDIDGITYIRMETT